MFQVVCYTCIIMKNHQVEQLSEEKVGAIIAHHFGLIQEFLDDQFALVHEKFEILEEKMDRGFAEIRQDLDQVKRNTDTNSLEILALQEKQKKTDGVIKKLTQETKSLDGRVGIIEHNYEFA